MNELKALIANKNQQDLIEYMKELLQSEWATQTLVNSNDPFILSFVDKSFKKRNIPYKITSNKFFCNKDARKISAEFQNSIDPFCKYFEINFCGELEKNQQNNIAWLEQQIKKYSKNLYINFIPYSYFKLLEKKQRKQSTEISFKPFASFNISLNIFSMMQAIYQQYISVKQCSKQQRNKMKQWLLIITQRELSNGLQYIKDYYPESQERAISNEEQINQMKKAVHKIDRRQNEEYDFFIMNNIQYTNPQQLIIKTIKRIYQISNKGFKLKQDSMFTLSDQIIKVNSLIFDQSNKQQTEKFNFENRNKFEVRQITEKEKSQYEEQPVRKIGKYLNLSGENKQQFLKSLLNIQKKQQSAKSGEVLRILMKFIENLLEVIYNPQNLTKLRSYPYKNYENELVYPNEKLNSIIYDQFLSLQKEIKDNTNSSLKKIKEKLFEHQMQAIFSYFDEFPQPQPLLERQLTISRKIYLATFEITFQYLQKLIELIVKAGVVQYDGRTQHINLVTFNVGDLFRARQSVSVNQFKNILNAIYVLQNPLPDSYLPPQDYFRLLRIKDKTDKQAKGVLLNYIYKNSVQCELQINTKLKGNTSHYQIHHLLYQLLRGQFGVISEMMTLIATKYNPTDHKGIILKQCAKETDQARIKEHEDITNRIQESFKAYKPNIARDQSENRQSYWTSPFCNRQQRKIDLQQLLKNKQKNRRVESLINPTNHNLQKIKKDNQTQFVKTIVINTNQYADPKNIPSFLEVKHFVCAQNIILNGFTEQNRMVSRMIKNIKFISRYSMQYLKELDLSHNEIDDISDLFKIIIFENLEKLNLSNNKLEGNMKFAVGWFPKLQILNLKKNKLDKFELVNSFTCNQTDQLVICIENFHQYVIDSCLLLQRKQIMKKWIKIDVQSNDLQIRINDQKSSLAILLGCHIQIAENMTQPETDSQIFHRPIAPDSPPLIHSPQKGINSKFKRQKKRIHSQSNQFLNLPRPLAKHQSSNNYELSSICRRLSEYRQKHRVFFKQLSGFIVRKTQNNRVRTANCIILNSKIVIAPAHCIIQQQEKQKWLDPTDHQQIKRNIIKRTLFQQKIQNSNNKKYHSIRDVWIPQTYFLRKIGKQNDICLLLLQKQSEKIEKQIQNVNLRIVFRQNSKSDFSCYLSASVFGYLERLQHYSSSFADVKYSGSQSFIQLKNSNFQDGASGSAVVYIQVTGKNSCNCYLMGLFNGKQGDSEGYAANINAQLKRVYEDMIALQRLQQYKDKPKICFQDFQTFRNRISTITSLENEIRKQENSLLLVKKLLKLFVDILERYLFLQQNQDNAFSSKIFIYNAESGGDSYEVDLRAIKLQFILQDLQPKQQFLSNFNDCKYYIDIEQKQLSTSKVLLNILASVVNFSTNDQAKYIINFLIRFIEAKLKECNQSNPISLFKVLIVIVQALTYKDTSQIQIYLKSLDSEDRRIFQDPAYFSMINILINLTSLRRIKYYAEMVRCSKDVPRFAFVSNDETGVINPDIKVKSNENQSTQEIKNISNMDKAYLLTLKKVKSYIQSQASSGINFQVIKHGQRFTNEISKVCMVETLKQFYEQQPSQQLLQVFNRGSSSQILTLIIQILQNRIRISLQRQFQETYLISDISKIRKYILDNIENEFQIVCFYYQYIINQRKQRQLIKIQPFNIQSNVTSATQIAQISNIQKKSSSVSIVDILQQKDESTRVIEYSKSRKQVIRSQGHLQTSLTEYEKLKNIDYDDNREIYQNHIGAVLIFDRQSQKMGCNWRQFIIGTGTLIQKRIVVTAAHLLSDFITGSFTKGKIRFKLTKRKNKDKPYKNVANVVQIRLIKNSDIAILLLDKDLIANPKIKLVTHNSISQKSNLKGRKYFCQIIGFPNSTELKKSQGYIFIQDIGLTNFKYSLPTDKGQSGAVILFFPTGNYNQPYILGIHTDGYSEAVGFFGYNGNRYVNQKFNSGKKIIKDAFNRSNKAVAIYVAEGQNTNQQILRYQTVHQNSLIFCDSMYLLNKWKLIHHINEAVLKEDPNKKYGLFYQEYLAYINQNLKFTEISPQNLLCYDRKKFHPYFSVSVQYKNDFSRDHTIDQNYQINQSRLFLEEVINSYHRYIQSYKMAAEYLKDIQDMKEGNLTQAKQKLTKIQKAIQVIFQQINQNFSITNNALIIRNQIQSKFKKITNFLKKCSIPSNNLKDIQHQLRQMNFLDLSKTIYKNLKQQSRLMYKNYQEFQANYFNDQSSFSEYVNYLLSQSIQEDGDIKDMVIQYIIVKIACEIVEKLFFFFFESRIKMLDSTLKVFNQFQLCKNAYNFIPPSLHYSKPSSLKQIYKNKINHRKQAIFRIQKISNLSQQLRQQQIENILEWQSIKKYWIDYIKDGFKLDEKDDDTEQIDQIIKDIYQKYHYSVSGHYHFVNIGRIVLEQISLLREIAQITSFS